jgi:hypothetical protein
MCVLDEPVIAPAAPRHGISDEGILHAYRLVGQGCLTDFPPSLVRR